jgi:ADP-heptose:LPS heptosyltransferase
MKVQDDAAPVVISPFANERVREWPISHYRRFIDRVLHDQKAPVLVIGTRPQRARANEVARGFPAPYVVNACGKLEWRELVALVDSAAYVVSNNSGVAHLAACRGLWTLCLFSGSHSYLEWMPRGPRVVVISRITACAPCHLGDNSCPHGVACMTDLEADRVFELFEEARISRTSHLSE